jgi:hypothetical protein
MSIKRILVPLPGSADHSSETSMALSAANALGARVEALFISRPQPVGGGRSAVGGMGYAGSVAALASINWYAEQRDKAAREAQERFACACAAAGIPMLAATSDETHIPAASWREEQGDYVEVAVHRAAASDLLVAASATVMEALKDIAEQSLVQTRRPVLLAPSHLENDLADSAMIAWDESPECWHAVSAAIPFLRIAFGAPDTVVTDHLRSYTAAIAGPRMGSPHVGSQMLSQFP